MSSIDDLIKNRMDSFAHGDALPHHAPHQHIKNPTDSTALHPGATEYRASFVFSPPLNPTEKECIETHLHKVFDTLPFTPRADITLYDPQIVERDVPKKTLLVFAFPLNVREDVPQVIRSALGRFTEPQEMDHLRRNLLRRALERQLAARLN